MRRRRSSGSRALRSRSAATRLMSERTEANARSGGNAPARGSGPKNLSAGVHSANAATVNGRKVTGVAR